MAKLPPSNVVHDAGAAPAAVVHHETSDANVNGIFAFGAALVIAGAIILFLVWLLFGYFSSRQAASGGREFPLAAEQQNRLPPEPRLQTNPKQDLIDLRAGEDAILNTYGWVDKTGGVVRIPISEAMKLTVERGLPRRTNDETKR
jgi:hypothetical protein